MLPYQSQAAGGYEWVCTDGEFSEEPAPDCSDCDAGTANPDAGAEVCNSCVLGTFMGDVGATECTNCPPNSNTEEEGATEVTQCMCDAGYSGDIQSAQDFCNVCIAGTYNEVSGPGDCENCPEYSTTLNEASTAVTACLCEAGHTGQIFAPSDVCTECPADTFKDSISSEPCSECPEHSSTLAGEGQTSPTACLCNAGFSGDIQSSQDACNACETDTFKKDVGTAPCDDCPANSGTDGQTAGDSASFCICNDGWSGTIIEPTDECEQADGGASGGYLSTQEIIGIAIGQ